MALRWRSKLWMAGLGLGSGILAYDVMQRRRRLEGSDLLSGQVALVTGGSKGLGLLIARELAREGCRLAICARDERELERAKFELRRAGAEVSTYVCDVADREQVETMIEKIRGSLGPVDVLVNNAGIITVGPVGTMTLPDFVDSMNVMYWGTVYPTLALLPYMLERGRGRIANITSIGGRISVPHLLTYCSAKFAAVGFSRGLRAELLQHGIQVTTVVPGLMRTGSFVNALFKGRQTAEYDWFGLSASLPVISVEAETAARRIVLAIKRGDAEYTVGFPARLAGAFGGVFPGATADLLSLVSRMLPGAEGAAPGELRKGQVIERRDGESLLWNVLTMLGRKATRRLQEHERPFAVADERRETSPGP